MRGRGAASGIRRAWPYVMMAWERWQSLSPAEKERYRQRARDGAARARQYADRGRTAIEKRRGGR